MEAVYNSRLITAAGIFALASIALAGCGGVSDTVNPVATATAAAVPATSSAAVSITGTPAVTATVGSTYSFTPTARASDGGTLVFAVTNLPSWAAFNTATGQISGTPKSSDTGTTLGIAITASEGSASASLPAFSITVTNVASNSGVATVAWAAPVQNTNGTPLTNLAGYRIYYGTNSASLNQTVAVTDPTQLSYVISGLTSGTWYFAVASYTTSGEESAPSAPVSKTI